MEPLIILVCSLLMASLWGAAAFHKLRYRTAFRATLGAYKLLPGFLLGPVSAVLPLLEIAVASGLLLGTTRSLAGQVSCAMLLLYAAAMAANLLRGRKRIDCGCGFGPGGQLISWQLVGRNLALAALTIMPLLSQPTRPLTGVDIVFAVLVAAFVWLACAIVSQLLRNQFLQNRSEML